MGNGEWAMGKSSIFPSLLKRMVTPTAAANN